jgi:hypothetical protein
VLGLAAVLAVPGAIVASRQATGVRLLDAAYAIPVAAFLGVAGLLTSRAARARIEWTLGRAGGSRVARIGRALAVLGICLAITGAISVGFYEILRYYER